VKVAFIGLGKMGAGMAARLIGAGYEVSVYNRTPAKADALVALGARLARNPLDACREVDAVFCMVADDSASRAMWMGPEGILAADFGPGGRSAPPDSSPVWGVECSTLSHAWVMELAARVADRGLRYIDCPVTGLPSDAAAGSLTLLVGAPKPDLEAARDLLSAFSNRIQHFGTVGTGTIYKLIINLLGAVQIASAAEGMALAQRAGLDLNVVAEAISLGQAASPQVARNVKRMADGDHDRNVVFTSALRLKDVGYALRLVQALQMSAPFGEAAERGLVELCERGRAMANESCVFEVALARQAPGGA
jgi:3-hydroxyisobutyrate dehydrogenase